MRINRGFLTLFCVYIGASLEICVYTTTLLPSLLPDNNVKAGSRSLCYTFAELYGIRECVFRFFGRLLCSLLLYHLDGMGDNSSGDSERCRLRTVSTNRRETGTRAYLLHPLDSIRAVPALETPLLSAELLAEPRLCCNRRLGPVNK